LETPKQLRPALDCAFGFSDQVIVEEYIKGREITVGILGDQALPVVEIVPKQRFFNFQAKYEQGQSDYIVPAKLSKSYYQRAQSMGLLAHNCLGCRGFSRIDMILNGKRPYVLEVNSIPGLTARSLLPMAARAKGIGFAQLCLKIIKLSLGRI
ncbi:MAG: ATP-grasp domain-containing protein, partial [Candidatus Omnitrophica bacterium]|nr:ATP-grasp domain-containing protein [Candidatus Omnitrophota bacterium]